MQDFKKEKKKLSIIKNIYILVSSAPNPIKLKSSISTLLAS